MGIIKASKHLERSAEQAEELVLSLTLAAEQLRGKKKERLLQSAADVKAAAQLSRRILRILRRHHTLKHRYDDATEVVEEIFEEAQDLYGNPDPSAKEDDSPGWQNVVRRFEDGA